MQGIAARASALLSGSHRNCGSSDAGLLTRSTTNTSRLAQAGPIDTPSESAAERATGNHRVLRYL